ncbi:hypothetical protein [Cellulosilyticum sp. I15G10I2]|uniref:hypothetical protein n=1 Tax=Cellulosilyticum sp. I15G10I2 TaxID=1892843 RepID=UPI00085BDF1B|nr:hypothetical protein [Cellulosilyticum sp. I15G10I2]
MSYQVIMLRSDATGNLVIEKEYRTQIPMKVIAYLALIEKRDWILFRDSPHNMFGEFIYHNLSYYSELAPYISRNNCQFEFVYEYITDSSELLHTIYYHNDIEISREEYLLYTYRKYYVERWIMVDLASNKALVFFECEYIPS